MTLSNCSFTTILLPDLGKPLNLSEPQLDKICVFKVYYLKHELHKMLLKQVGGGGNREEGVLGQTSLRKC